MKDRGADPRILDLAACARSGAALQGSWPIAGMQRLAAALAAVPDTAVAWTAHASRRPVAGGDPETWLQLQAQCSVPLQCQRCLQPLLQPLAVDRRLRFVATEAEAEALDEEIEEDVLVLEPRLDLHALVEDELILALPIVPRHEVCPEPLPAPDGGAGASASTPNPFAVLAALRGGAAGGGADDR